MKIYVYKLRGSNLKRKISNIAFLEKGVSTKFTTRRGLRYTIVANNLHVLIL